MSSSTAGVGSGVPSAGSAPSQNPSDDRCILQRALVLPREPIDPRGDRPLHGVGERGGHVAVPQLDRSILSQHHHELGCEERVPARPCDNRREQLRRHRAVEQVLHQEGALVGRHRQELQCREVRAAAPTRACVRGTRAARGRRRARVRGCGGRVGPAGRAGSFPPKWMSSITTSSGTPGPRAAR